MVGFEQLGSLDLDDIVKAFQAKSALETTKTASKRTTEEGRDLSLAPKEKVRSFFEGKSQSQIDEEIRREEKSLDNSQRLAEIMEERSPDNQAKKLYEQRIDKLFADFDNNLPDDFKRFATPELAGDLNATKKNIRGLAEDMHKLSELAGGDPELEKKAEKITANLLDRLKNDLGLSPEERKKLDGKSLEEIQQYYAETRSDKLGKLNETVNGYRQELHQLVEQTTGKSPEEKTKIYQDKLDEIELKTGQKKGHNDLGITLTALKHEEVSINDVKVPVFASNTVSERALAEKSEKSKMEIEV